MRLVEFKHNSHISIFWSSLQNSKWVKETYVWYLINYIFFLVLLQQITYKKYILLPRMSEIMEDRVAFPTPVFVCGTAFISWRFCLVAVNCRKCLLLYEIYVFLLQNIRNIIHCIFVWDLVSICHISHRCNQIIGLCKTEKCLLWNCLNCVK